MKSTQNDNYLMLSERSMQVLRHTFEINQQRLEDEVLALGSQVEEILVLSMQTLWEQNTKQAMHLLADNRSLNQKYAAIESDTLALLETEWPTDRDLFVLASILEIAFELEHIHDHATTIAGINLKMHREKPLSNPFSDFSQLGEMTGNMLHQAMKAFADKDLDLARFVPTQYNRVTELYQHNHQILLKVVKADQATVNQAFYLSQVGHQLERIADRTTHICEWVAFSITGEMRKLKIN